MAYAALTSLLQTLKQIRQPEQRIASLLEKVSRLLVMLEDSSRNSSLTIDHLEAQVRDASYQVEYIIESYISSRALSKPMSWRVSSCFWEMISALRLCERSVEYMDQNMDFQDLQKRIEEFDSILETLSKMNSSALACSSRLVASSKSTMEGRDEEMVLIKDRLCGHQSKLDVISIVGMGGIGKTTFARNLYNDPLIEYYFDIRAWIVVSRKYNVQKVLTGLLDSMKRGVGQFHEMSIEELGERLCKELYGRRYLIVINDVWDIEFWDMVKMFFPDSDNGSRIILTTCLSEVAIYANSYGPVFHMRLQSSEESWHLLREYVFGEEYCPPTLEEIGKKIAQDCKGHPLAIALIGGILSKGIRTQGYWEHIEENVKSAVIGNDFTGILSLSYNSLPPHLKPCFLYMGVFPEDHEIFVSQLIKMWIAEDFIKPLAPKSLEEVAEDYLKDLIERNLITVRERKSNGGIKACTIHDVLRDLCVKIAHDEKSLQIINSDIQVFPKGKNKGKNNQFCVSIHSDTSVRLTNIHVSSIRTLLYFCGSFSNSKLPSIIRSCRLLRVLDALTIRFYKFPIEIVGLVHLRYLAFTYEGTKGFPASISKLRDLQTLIVYRGDTFTLVGKLTTLYLPSAIWEMPQLRHLLFEKILLPATVIEKDSLALENLQTLSGIINFRCSRKVMEMIPNLKKLGISYFYGANTEWSSYEFKNFVYLYKLETLKLHFIADSVKALLVNLTFPPNLRKLTLSGCRISWKKMTVVGSLSNLEVLKLKDHAFEGPIWEPNKGEFRKLKFLLIEKSSLEQWRAKYTHFPNLQHLSLSYCPKLREIPSELGEILTLEMLELYECSVAAMDSALRIQEEQQHKGNNGLRIRVKSSRGY